MGHGNQVALHKKLLEKKIGVSWFDFAHQPYCKGPLAGIGGKNCVHAIFTTQVFFKNLQIVSFLTVDAPSLALLGLEEIAPQSP